MIIQDNLSTCYSLIIFTLQIIIIIIIIKKIMANGFSKMNVKCKIWEQNKWSSSHLMKLFYPSVTGCFVYKRNTFETV